MGALVSAFFSAFLSPPQPTAKAVKAQSAAMLKTFANFFI
jgi:hypothetical protein